MSIMKKPHPNKAFSPAEDTLLRQLVHEYGTHDWSQIATLMPSRNTRQVRERWCHYLRPNLNMDPWTEEEEELLKRKHEELGNQWKRIAQFFNGRTEINIKSKYRMIERSIRREQNKLSKKTANNKVQKNEIHSNMINSFLEHFTNNQDKPMLITPSSPFLLTCQIPLMNNMYSISNY